MCSWPGKYEGAWDSLVSASRELDVSAAVVFLPDGTGNFGKHEIPEHEGLPLDYKHRRGRELRSGA